MNFNLKRGDRGQEVGRMQESLNKIYGNVSVDKIFGPKTEAALIKYKTNLGLGETGIYDFATQASMGNEIWQGIDVSSNNGTIEWTKVAKTQKFAIVKASEGYTFRNKERVKQYKFAKAAGLLVGAYHYARPDTDAFPNDALKEAGQFIECLKEKGWERGVDLAPILDLEEGMKSDDQYNVDWANKFCEYIKRELGVTPTVYTANWYFQAYMRDASKSSLEAISKYPVWWADYTTDFGEDPNLSLWNSWQIWQWTGSGRIDGVVGKVDRNWLPGGSCGITRLLGV